MVYFLLSNLYLILVTVSCLRFLSLFSRLNNLGLLYFHLFHFSDFTTCVILFVHLILKTIYFNSDKYSLIYRSVIWKFIYYDTVHKMISKLLIRAFITYDLATRDCNAFLQILIVSKKCSLLYFYLLFVFIIRMRF